MPCQPCANPLCGGKIYSTRTFKRFCSERCEKEDRRLRNKERTRTKRNRR